MGLKRLRRGRKEDGNDGVVQRDREEEREREIGPNGWLPLASK